MGLFGTAHGLRGGGGGDKKASRIKMFHTYLAMMKLGIVITYLNKIQKIY